MELSQIVAALKPLFDSSLSTAVVTTSLSVLLGSYVALRTYRHQSKELVDGTVAWEWVHRYDGYPGEEPRLVLQNRSAVAAFIKRARYLRGIFIRTEVQKYAFSYDEPTDGNFPLAIKAQGVTSFPLSISSADEIAKRARWYSRWSGYLLKRSYLWIEITTISGHRLMIPANDATSFQDRPLWLECRWFPEPRPDWMGELTTS